MIQIKLFMLMWVSGCLAFAGWAQKEMQPVDLVYPQLDTENSRWIFFSSACRPFGMVNLSPDTCTAFGSSK
jgi:putative alpha-1,2-mannosidase